jgi:hypothetical protein
MSLIGIKAFAAKYWSKAAGFVAAVLVMMGLLYIIDSTPIVDESYSTHEKTVYVHGKVVTDPVLKQKILAGRYEFGSWLE